MKRPANKPLTSLAKIAFAWVLALVLVVGCTQQKDPDSGKGASAGGVSSPKGWFMTVPMSVPRFLHTATRLPDGKVLVAGGCGKTGAQRSIEEDGLARESIPDMEVICLDLQSSAEVFDPKTGKWSAVSPMEGGFVTPDGKPKPVAGKFIGRFEHQAVLIAPGPKPSCGSNCGKVLVIGGNGPNEGQPLIEGTKRSAELFDPKTGKWVPVPAPERLDSGAAIFLPAGRGSACAKACGKVLMVGRTMQGESAAELFDPVKSRWHPVEAPPVSLGFPGFTANLLPTGEVLVLGGLAAAPKPSAGASGGRALPADPALYNPGKNTWRLLSGAGSVFRSGHTATVLKDGRVLVAAGTQTATSAVSSSAELLDPPAVAADARGAESKPARSMTEARKLHLAVRLPGGKVLVTGGSPALKPDHLPSQGPSGAPANEGVPPKAEIYDPATNRWRPAGGDPAYRGPLRKSMTPVFTATSLSDGRVLVAGGVGADDRALATTDIYRP